MSIAIAVSFPLLIEAHMPTLLPPPVPQGIRGLMISTNRDHQTVDILLGWALWSARRRAIHEGE